MHVTSFMRGLTIGLVLGILFAPDSGIATRRKLLDIASDMGDDMKDAYDDLSGTVADKVDQVKGKANEIAGNVKRGVGL